MQSFYVFSIIALPLLFILSFFFSASETSIIAFSKLRLKHLVAKKVKGAKTLENIVLKLDKVIAAILIGNTLVNIAISVILTTILVLHLGYKWGSIVSTFASTAIILIFCEITPKILATKHTEKVALFTAPLMERFILAFAPFITFFTSITNFLLGLFGIGHTKRSPLITEEELRLMIEVGKEEGVLSDQERKMLHRIFEFGDIRICDVMVPKEKMAAVSINLNFDQLLNILVEEGHERVPVYRDSIDNIVGVIHARDMLYIIEDKELFVLQDLVNDVYHAPAALRVNEMLQKFQADKIQIAIVVDEHQKTLGMVTLEDLIEEIVGEIEEKRGRRPRK